MGFVKSGIAASAIIKMRQNDSVASPFDCIKSGETAR